jgi:DNA primase
LRRENFEAGQFSRVEKPITGKYRPPKGAGPMLAAHRLYLRKRGLDPVAISTLWNVGGVGGFSAAHRWRLFIPVHDRGGKPVSWTTRHLKDDHSMRYLAAPPDREEVPGKSLLYGEELVPGHAVAVQEGHPDVWRVGPGAVCTGGVAVTREQVVKVAKYSLRVVCFDAEPEAQARAGRLCEELSVFPGQTVNVVFESGKDASRASEKEVIQLREMLR